MRTFNFPDLENEQAVLNFIGKKTIMKFQIGMDCTLTYRTVVPKYINEEYHYIEVTLFYKDTDDFLDYDEFEKLMYGKQVFEVKIFFPESAKLIYHKKYIDPNNN